MSESDDNWPNFDNFDPGPQKHLHAVGVISSCYNSFERILFEIYIHHLDRKKYKRLISEGYFLALDEQKRVQLVKAAFLEFEKNKNVIERIDNLVGYFNWCWTVRNNVLHGEAYPKLFGSKSELSLSKRPNKRSHKTEYLTLDLPTLRYLAERVEIGRLQAAKINLHLRFRDTSPHKRSAALRIHGREPLPKRLQIPTALKLSERPHNGPGPQYQLGTSNP